MLVPPLKKTKPGTFRMLATFLYATFMCSWFNVVYFFLVACPRPLQSVKQGIINKFMLYKYYIGSEGYLVVLFHRVLP